jgi:hypothetical protein
MPEGRAENSGAFPDVFPRWRVLRLAEPVVNVPVRDLANRSAILKDDMQN